MITLAQDAQSFGTLPLCQPFSALRISIVCGVNSPTSHFEVKGAKNSSALNDALAEYTFQEKAV